LENLLALCLQFIHLVSRVNLINVTQPDSTPKSNGSATTNLRQTMTPLLSNRSNMGRSEGPLSGGGANLSYRTNSTVLNNNNICTSISPAPSTPSFFRALPFPYKKDMQQNQHGPMNYILTVNFFVFFFAYNSKGKIKFIH
jgi:hypothetical protein